MPEENIIAQHQALMSPRRGSFGNEVGLGKAIGRWLHEGEERSPLRAITEKPLKLQLVFWGRDNSGITWMPASIKTDSG